MSNLGWRIVFASVIGTSHQKNSTVCQDASGYRLAQGMDGSEVLLAIASDGAGSAKKSEVGSQLTVSSFLNYFEEKLKAVSLSEIDKPIALKWMQDVHAQIQELATQENLHPREYSCTVLAAIVGQHDAVFFQIGDGAIVVSEKESPEFGYIFWPQHGEFANQTNFLFQENLNEVIEFELIKRSFETLIIFTDGIERLVLDFSSKTVHSPALQPIVDWLGKAAFPTDNSPSSVLQTYLSSDFINSRTDDDKTLVMATRTSG
jgi:hypothetical protein